MRQVICIFWHNTGQKQSFKALQHVKCNERFPLFNQDLSKIYNATKVFRSYEVPRKRSAVSITGR